MALLLLLLRHVLVVCVFALTAFRLIDARATTSPSLLPTVRPTRMPTYHPSPRPTRMPTAAPTSCFYTPPPSSEVNALYSLYNATNGQHWSWKSIGAHWDFTVANSNPCSNWQGITCVQVSSSDQSCVVSSLELKGYNLQGTIPQEISELQALSALQLASNSGLAGTIPRSIFNMTSLMGMDLSVNSLNGSIPEAIGQLTQLQVLMLNSNYFTSTIPISITKLTHLFKLYLYSNLLYGDIPKDIGNLVQMQDLRMSVNKLSGTIPPSIANMTKLASLFLNNNTLHGPVPESFANLALLLTLTIDNNLLSGSFPTCLTTLPSLKKLLMNINNMRGSIPAAIGNMNAIRYLQFNSNYFTGTIPSTITNLTNLVDLQFLNNQFHGSIPEDIGKLANLETFYFFYNYFSGTIPSSITELSNLDSIDFSYNYLHGSIPENIGNLVQLTQLTLNNNFLTGTIPASITNLAAVAFVALNNNLLHGNIPADINSMTALSYFDISTNSLFGTIPSSLALAPALASCYFDNNQFTGVLNNLPSTIRQLFVNANYFHGSLDWISNVPQTRSLALNNNSFTGTLPSAFQSLQYLVAVNVQGNLLFGSISNRFDPSKQVSLSVIDLSDNAFTGSIPPSIFQFPYLTYFSAVSNCFTGSIPDTICYAKSYLETMVLDGLHSATICQKKLFPSLNGIDTLAPTNAITGSIPSCLFGEMPALQILHISGNALTGQLPDNYYSLGSQLQNVSISHNSLTGSIPLTFQQHGWVEFDVSFNELTGDLSDSFNVSGFTKSGSSAGLKLSNNRLSGDIPSVVLDLPKLDILAGNMFGCKNQDRAGTLPQNDGNYKNYVCGSDETNGALITYLVILVCILMFLYLMRLVPFSIDDKQEKWTRGVLDTLKDMCIETKALLELGFQQDASTTIAGKDSSGLTSFLKYARQLQLHFGLVTTVLVLIFIVVNGSLGVKYSNYTFRYVWSISTAYLSGFAPGMCLFVFMLVILLWLFLDVKWFRLCMVVDSPTYQNLIKVSNLMHVAMGSAQRTLEGGVDSKEKTSEKSSPSLFGTLQLHYKAILIAIAYVSVNVAVVLVINGVYVALIISGITARQQAILTVAMSLFKDGWSMNVMQSLRWQSAHSIEDILGDTTITRLVLAVCLFNNIIAPALATAFVNTNCFYYALVPAPNVEASVYISGCVNSYNNGYCAQSIVLDLSTNYQPPFTYSYQCTSTLLALFAPVWIYMFIFSNIVRPLVSLLCTSYNPFALTYYYPYLSNLLRRKLFKCSIQTLMSDDEQVTKKVIEQLPKSILKSRELTVALCNIIAIMLCFGVLFPLLAIAGFIALVAQLLWNQIYTQKIFSICQKKIQQHMDIAAKEETIKTKEVISLENLHINPFLTVDMANDIVVAMQKECLAFPFTFTNTVKSIVLYVSVIWGLFLWDIIGDEVGVNKSFWVFFLLLLTGISIRLQSYVFAYFQVFSSAKDEDNSDPKVSKGLELEARKSSHMVTVENPMNKNQTRKEKEDDDEQRWKQVLI